MAFTINKYLSYGERRDAKIDRIQAKIAKLESKDELIGKKAARLERLIKKLDRLTPEDEFFVHYRKGSDTFGVTIVDSTYDDTLIGGQHVNLVINGRSANRSSQETRLALNHPEGVERYSFGDNETVSVGGVKATDIFDMDSTIVSLQSNGKVLFAQTI